VCYITQESSDFGQGKGIFLLQNLNTGSGDHAASYLTGTEWGVGMRGAFPGSKAAVELTTLFHPKQKTRVLGAILPFLHTPSCNAGVKFYFYLYLMVEWK
jgi:hypothetical protein